jgi:hypothetical protein
VGEALQKAGGSFEAQSGSRPTLEALIDSVSKAFGVTAQQLKSRTRSRIIVQARPPRLSELRLAMAGGPVRLLQELQSGIMVIREQRLRKLFH